MSKLEKEVKVLNIDIDHTRDKLTEIGATFINKKEQEIYTYDIPTIYYRYLECIQLLKSEKELVKGTHKELNYKDIKAFYMNSNNVFNLMIKEGN